MISLLTDILDKSLTVPLLLDKYIKLVLVVDEVINEVSPMY